MISTTNLKALLFFYYSALTIIVSYLPVYFQEQGLSGREIGVLLAVGPFAALLSQPVWGFMTDKYKSAKKMLILCLAGSTLFSLFVGLVNHYQLLIAAVFLFFVFMSPVGGLGDSLAQRTASRLSVSFGAIRMWGSLGFAVMSLLSGLLLERIGVQYFLIPYLAFIIITLVISFRVNDIETNETKQVAFKETVKLFKIKPFVFFLIVMMFITITHRANDSFLGIFIIEKGGTEAFIGWAWFIGVSSEVVMLATATLWYRKCHPLLFITFSGVLFTLRWFLLAIIDTPLLILPLQVLHGITFSLFYLCAFQFISKLIPEKMLSTGHLLFYSVFFGLSGMIGSSIGGIIIDNESAAYLYFLFAITAAVGTVFLAVYTFVYLKGINLLKRKSEI